MDALNEDGPALRAATRRLFRRSLHVYPLNAGSCNGCETELAALLGPERDLGRHGIALVTTPSHADLLLVTGPITRHLREPLLRAYQAMPAPRLVVAVGACACTGGVFCGAYAVDGPLDRHLPVDIYVPGCPPTPEAILHGLLIAIGKAETRMKGGRIGTSGTRTQIL